MNVVWQEIIRSAKGHFSFDSFVSFCHPLALDEVDELLLITLAELSDQEELDKVVDWFCDECSARGTQVDRRKAFRVLGSFQNALATEIHTLKAIFKLLKIEQDPQMALKRATGLLAVRSQPPLSIALREAILGATDLSLESCYYWDISAREDSIELTVKKETTDSSYSLVIRVTWSHKNREIHIPNIFMPVFMRNKSIGKTILKEIYSVAKAYGYHLFLVMMTSSFFDRMKRRGAKVITHEDCVQITDETDLDPREMVSAVNS